jgi:hypothetical protein
MMIQLPNPKQCHILSIVKTGSWYENFGTQKTIKNFWNY